MNARTGIPSSRTLPFGFLALFFCLSFGLGPELLHATNGYGLPAHGDDLRCRALAQQWFSSQWLPANRPADPANHYDEWGREIGPAITAEGGMDGFAGPWDYWLRTSQACLVWVRDALGDPPAPPAASADGGLSDASGSSDSSHRPSSAAEGVGTNSSGFDSTPMPRSPGDPEGPGAPTGTGDDWLDVPDPSASPELGELVSESQDPVVIAGVSSDPADEPAADESGGASGAARALRWPSSMTGFYLVLGSGWHKNRDLYALDYNWEGDSSGRQAVASVGDGEVVFAAMSTVGYGNYIKIRHRLPDGRVAESQYAHLDRMEVRVGQHVTQGQIIGRVGTTGNSEGHHLHFDLDVDEASARHHEYIDFGSEASKLQKAYRDENKL